MPLAPPSPGFELALIRLPGRLRRALRLFRTFTGLPAVSAVATTPPEPGMPFALSPPVHPRCAAKLRSIRHAPCAEQWRIHLRSGRRSLRAHSHTCPIGMRCACVPIHLEERLVGVAKLVVDGDTPEPVFKKAMSVLGLVVSDTCATSSMALLSEEVRVLRQRVAELRQMQAKNRPSAPASAPDAAGAALVERALAHLQRHHVDSTLSLEDVAGALNCNPKYLTTRFTQTVGERMHTYLVALRVSHACLLLISTDLRVKEIAHASGFSGAAGLAGAFRRHVGVSPAEYRRIFAEP